MSETDTPEEDTPVRDLIHTAQKAADLEITFGDGPNLAKLLEAVGEEAYKEYIDSRYYKRLEGTTDIASPLTAEEIEMEIGKEARKEEEEAAQAEAESAEEAPPPETPTEPTSPV